VALYKRDWRRILAAPDFDDRLVVLLGDSLALGDHAQGRLCARALGAAPTPGEVEGARRAAARLLAAADDARLPLADALEGYARLLARVLEWIGEIGPSASAPLCQAMALMGERPAEVAADVEGATPEIVLAWVAEVRVRDAQREEA